MNSATMNKIEVEAILSNEDLLEKFAALHHRSIQASRELLERLLEQPEIDARTEEYIHSADRSEDFKGFQAGLEWGCRKGFKEGFAKGVAAVLALAAVAGVAVLALRK